METLPLLSMLAVLYPEATLPVRLGQRVVPHRKSHPRKPREALTTRRNVNPAPRTGI